MTNRPQTLGKKARNSAALLAAARLVTRSLAVAQLLIFYQIQGREDTGLIGIGLTTLAAVDVFSQFGVRKALIQRPGDILAYLPTGYAVEMFRGVLVCSVILLLAPAIAGWFQNEEAVEVLRYFALVPLIRGLASINTISLERELNFRRVVILDLAAPITDFVVTITWLLVAPSVLALVAGKICGTLCHAILSHIIVTRNTWPGWSWAYFWELNRFGRWVLLIGIVGMVLTRGPDFVAGRLLTTGEFGDLTLATMIAIMPMMEFNNILNRVAFPAYANIQNQIDRLRRAFLATFLTTTIIIVAIMTFIILSAPAFVLFLKGHDNFEFVWLIQLVAIWGGCRALGATTSSLFMARGMPGYISYYHFIMLFIVGVTIYPMTKHAGLLGFGGTLATVGLTAQALRYRLVARLIEERALVLYRQTLPPFIIAAATYLLAVVLQNYLLVALPRNIQVLLLPVIGIFLFAIGLAAWNQATGSQVIFTVKNTVQGRATGSLTLKR